MGEGVIVAVEPIVGRIVDAGDGHSISRLEFVLIFGDGAPIAARPGLSSAASCRAATAIAPVAKAALKKPRRFTRGRRPIGNAAAGSSFCFIMLTSLFSGLSDD